MSKSKSPSKSPTQRIRDAIAERFGAEAAAECKIDYVSVPANLRGWQAAWHKDFVDYLGPDANEAVERAATLPRAWFRSGLRKKQQDVRSKALDALLKAYKGDEAMALLDVAGACQIAIAYINRETVEAYGGAKLTDEEWEKLVPYLCDVGAYDEVVTQDSEVQAVFIDECLDKAGIVFDVEDQQHLAALEAGSATLIDRPEDKEGEES